MYARACVCMCMCEAEGRGDAEGEEECGVRERRGKLYHKITHNNAPHYSTLQYTILDCTGQVIKK